MNKFDINNLARPSVLKLEPYSSARDEFSNSQETMVFLDANENPFQSDVNRYPDPQQRDVKALLAAQRGISPENVLLGNGSDEVLDLVFRAFCEPNIDGVITLPPTYGMYKVLAGVNAVANNEIYLTADFSLPVAEILKQQNKHTKLLFICSPNNPTGNSFEEQDILKLLYGFNGIVVIDEAYIDFSVHESWLKRLEEFPNLVITQTLSKAYGMAGIRLGICIASKAIIGLLNKIKPPYNVNELTQQTAIDRLLNISDVIYETNSIIEYKKYLIKQLLQVNFIKKVYPSDANFVLVKVDDAAKRYVQLLEAGIVVRNRSNQPLCENTLRFTIGTEEENIKLIHTLQSL